MDNLADELFIEHRVRVYFGDEFVKTSIPYHIIFCRGRSSSGEIIEEFVLKSFYKPPLSMVIVVIIHLITQNRFRPLGGGTQR